MREAAVVPDNILSAVLDLATSVPNQYLSTVQDLARGKASEIEYLNGYVVRLAAKLDVQAPVNRLLLVMVKLIESEGRRLQLDRMLGESQRTENLRP